MCYRHACYHGRAPVVAQPEEETLAITTSARLPGDDGHITVPQAMRELGASRSRVLALAIRGDLCARQVAGQIVIERASIDALRAKRSSIRAKQVRAP